MNLNLKSLVELFIHDQDELEKFGEWAFGKNYKSLYGFKNFMDNWNIIHGDLLMLDEKGRPKDDMSKMVELWNNHKNIVN